MEDESKKDGLSKKDQDYLNNTDNAFDSDNMLGLASVGNVFSGLSESQSSKAIELDEAEIKEIKEKKESKDELTSDQQVKLSIHDIQSGRFKNFFKAVDADLTEKPNAPGERENTTKPKFNNETGEYEQEE
jgi:hypothetical protein